MTPFAAPRRPAAGRKGKKPAWAGDMARPCAGRGNFRRRVARYGPKLELYRAFFHLACLIIGLNRFCNGF